MRDEPDNTEAEDEPFDPGAAERPVSTDTGEPMPAEEAAHMHALLIDGKIALAPGVAEQLEAAGMTVEDIRQTLLAGAKKALS